ncbi:MAG: acetyl-CoA acetyltransferase [Deltaproteobacteria bacterium]|nr:acetyl-CoA acetyltransferase [Deltaproteobacteria bacterium]
MNDETSVVLIGVGQAVQHDIDPSRARGPVDLMMDAARSAGLDSGLGPAVLAKLDTVAIVDIFAWQPGNAARLLADAVGARPRREIVSTLGGNTPQACINYLAREIGAGRCGFALMGGANVVGSMMKARAAGVRLAWPSGGEGSAERFGDDKQGSSDYENTHALYLPAHIYPLFENALRARRGLSPQAHNMRIGAMFEEFTKVASRNPYAWFPVERSAQEIATASDSNRFVAFPYTKYMNAVMAVDQAAVVLLTSVAEARRLGVPEERWVYFWGGGEASENPWYVSERPRLDRCPAMRFACTQALARAGITVEAVDLFDFYSCFPVAVELGCEGLGLAEDDPRGLTVTGGLPYFGGPGNNYTTHAIAAMAERLRLRPGAKGLVTANGWYLTKHAAGVYASAPKPSPSVTIADPPPAEASHCEGPVRLVREPQGAAVIESYTVVYAREGHPETGIVVGRLESGERFLAHTPQEPAILEEMVTNEAVGRRGSVRASSPVNLFTPE